MLVGKTKAAERAEHSKRAGLNNRLICSVCQLCLHTQADFWRLGAYLKPLFLSAEDVVPCCKVDRPAAQPNSKLYQRTRPKLPLCDRTTSVLSKKWV